MASLPEEELNRALAAEMPELSEKAARMGAFRSVADLQRAIVEFLDVWNARPKPYVWTTSAEAILEKITKCCRRLEEIHPDSTKPRGHK